MSKVPWLALVAILVTPAVRAQCELARAEQPPGRAESSLGESIAADGEVLVVGNPYANVGGIEQAGEVYLYVRSEGAWQPRQVVTSSDPQPFSRFGYDVAMEGEHVVVGAPGSFSIVGYRLGRVHVLERDRAGTPGLPEDDTWSEAELIQDFGVSHQFGFSVALSGTTLVVGAPLKGFQENGTLFVYEKTASGWPKVLQRPGSPNSQSAWSVDVEGDRLVFGVPGLSELPPVSGNASRTGGVHVFDRVANDPGDPLDDEWVETELLTSAVPTFGAALGQVVALAGNAVVASALGETVEGAVLAGAAYYFEDDGAGWAETRLVSAEPRAVGRFGQGLGLTSEHLAIGGRSSPAGALAGSVLLYERTPAGLQLDATLTGSRSGDGADFGEDLELFDGGLVVGAWHEENASGLDGAAYLFGLGGPECSLGADHTVLSLTAGGTQELRLDAGAALANRPYLVLVSASGTEPGFPVGSVVLPLAVDTYTAYALTHPNQAPYANNLGFLDASGRAQASFTLAPGAVPGLVGTTLQHAFLVFDASSSPAVAVFASNPLGLRLLP